MKKMLIAFGILVIFLFMLSQTLVNKLDRRGKERASHVTQKVVVGKDTVLIIGYNFFGDDFTLSSGVKVDHAFVERFTVK